MNKELIDEKDLIKFEDFDVLGMFELDDAEGIEWLVTPIGNGKFISRANPYWAVASCAEISDCRESLKEILPFVQGKKKFVVLDYMSNFSAKVFYEEVKRSIIDKDKSRIEQARACLIEDTANLINLLEGKATFEPTHVLPQSENLIEERNIECNNFPLLYIFTKSLKPPKDHVVLNTGLGGVFIGPFFKNIHGVDWTNMLKSKYVQNLPISNDTSLVNRIENIKLLKNKQVLLLDDNVGTGTTIEEIVTQLKIADYTGKCGAVLYNWRNFHLVGIGEKTGIKRFNPFYIDYVTQFNFPGHKLMKHAIQILCGQRDLEKNVPSQDTTTPWGKLYNDYLHSKNYKNAEYCDILRMKYKGVEAAFKAGIDLPCHDALGKPTYKNNLPPETQSMMRNLEKFTQDIVNGKQVEKQIHEIKNQYIVSNPGQPGDDE